MSQILLSRHAGVLSFVVLLFSFVGSAQDATFIIPDSLKSVSYDDILSRHVNSYQDTLQSQIYLNTYYKKAILDDNDLKKSIALGYISYYVEGDETKVEVINLAIHYAKKSGDKEQLMIINTLAGGYYFLKSSYDMSLDFYFTSLMIAKEIQNEYYIYVNKHNIAIIKSDIGNDKEALKLLKECYDREVRIDDKVFLLDYLISALYLSESFIRNEQLDSANFYLEKIVSKTNDDYSDIRGLALVYLSISSNKDTKEDYENLSSSLHKIRSQGENANRFLTIGNYHAGLMSKKLGNEKSKIHFQEVDSLHSNHGIYIPEVRFSLENLIKHYKEKAQPKNQLHYVDKLLTFDSIYNKQKNLLGSKINTYYDTPILLSEKEQLIKSLNKQNTTLGYNMRLLFILVIFLFFIAIYLFKRNKKLKRRFDTIITRVDTPNVLEQIKQPIGKKNKTKELTISPKIIEEVLVNLSKFESKKEFTNKNLTAASLAKKIGTNSKYLSQIVNHHKNKNLTSYINDLRINYTIELLKSDRKFLNYTIQSIAEEVGFNNAESFSKAFFKNTEIKPSYFIKKMKMK